MNDDWSSTTDERNWGTLRIEVPATDESGAAAADTPERDLALLDAVYHELPLDESQDPRPNSAEEQDVDDVLMTWLGGLSRSRS